MKLMLIGAVSVVFLVNGVFFGWLFIEKICDEFKINWRLEEVFKMLNTLILLYISYNLIYTIIY